MKTKTIFEFIEATQNAPVTLSALSDEFISVETSFTQIVLQQQKEQAELDERIKTEKNYLNSKFKKIIADKEKTFKKGDYIPPVVKDVCKVWARNVQRLSLIHI